MESELYALQFNQNCFIKKLLEIIVKLVLDNFEFSYF